MPFCASCTSVEKKVEYRCKLHKKSKVFYTMQSKSVSKGNLLSAIDRAVYCKEKVNNYLINVDELSKLEYDLKNGRANQENAIHIAVAKILLSV